MTHADQSTLDLDDAGRPLGRSKASIPPAEAEALLRAHFGIDGCATPLSSERDDNFHITANGAPDRLLKIASAAEADTVINLQTELLRHIERTAPAIPVPRLLAARDRSDELALTLSDGQRHVVRLMSFLPGRPLAAARDPVAFCAPVARTLAALHAALSGFDHPAADHGLLWDATRADRVRPLLRHIADRRRRELAERMLDGFEEHGIPSLPRLRRQVIHNDFNPSNLLVDDDAGTVVGIIDFGDAIRAPLISDVATAIAYRPTAGTEARDAIAAMIEFVRHYHSANRLAADERDVCLDLVRARQVIVLAVSAWRAECFPAHRDYILRNDAQIWTALQGYACLSRADARRALGQACDVG